MNKKYTAIVFALSVISASLLATSAGASSDITKQRVPNEICETAEGFAQPTVLPVAARAAYGLVSGAMHYLAREACFYDYGCDPGLTTLQGNTDILFDH